jgi:hypothetical protein
MTATRLPEGLRIGAALALWLLGALEFLQFLAVLPAPSAYSLAAHGALSVLAVWSGCGLWLGARWAHLPVLLLGFAVGITRLAEGFVLGTRPWLLALLVAVAAIIAALLFAARFGQAR